MAFVLLLTQGGVSCEGAGSVLTAQLYFPDEPANRRDGLWGMMIAALLVHVLNSG
jgi:hypothetical protein